MSRKCKDSSESNNQPPQADTPPDAAAAGPARAGNYAVGFGKPPKHTQFRKGHSGNPRGRPRKPKPKRPRLYEMHTEDYLEKEAYRPVVLRENGKEIELPAAQAALRSLGVQGIKGSRLSNRDFWNRVERGEQEQRRRLLDRYERYERLKRDGERIVESYRTRGLAPPELLPHPDDIVLDAETGESWVNGPETKADLASYLYNVEFRDHCMLVASRDRKFFTTRERPDEEPVYSIWLVSAHLLDRCLPQRMRWSELEETSLLMKYLGLSKKERERRIADGWSHLVATRPHASRLTPEMQWEVDKISQRFIAQLTANAARQRDENA